ncbi:stage II sporulation protein D [Priestia taiwanensis]|uniref:Stage II sporulation protein D n=1 Tax=Priestia taiwanensis TaxID=1347902 RepID=A0A917AX58_9BACI|nr:stage II sporulation protein D [Priestia taiwanensis]MBM7364348.1 stage II sporulation protein D [Priestia taiwanensis]GGE85201.1 stage II sporulation protein D [Priestia taiwanensis]
MSWWKPWMTIGVIFFCLVVLIPPLLVLPFHQKEDMQVEGGQQRDHGEKEIAVDVAVFRSKLDKVENIPLEEYVMGVVSAEMPSTFEVEALKAQALSARTYIMKILVQQDGGVKEKNADVTDTVRHQVYKSREELKVQWKDKYDENIKKVEGAITATKGQVLTYGEELIVASFFSMSNGQTEDSEDIWGSAHPYLQSVESNWEEELPSFKSQVKKSIAEVEKVLEVKVNKDGSVGTIVSRTKGNRVKEVSFNGKKITGKDIRTKLGLRSTDFTWEQQGTDILITTKGFGHGVGMSQYGANGMAKEGKKYTDITNYYYQGTEIMNIEKFQDKLLVKK